MARVARTRTRVLRGSVTGSCVRTPIAASWTTTTDPLGSERCVDSFGAPWVDSAFTLERMVAPAVTLSGTRTQSGLTYVSTNVPLNPAPYDYLLNPWNYGAFQRTPQTSAALAAMAVANANPNTPDVDLPVSILELRELPSLLKDATQILAKAGSVPRNSAKANLMAQFGILPIISDVQKLFNFAKSVNDREKYLRELASGKKRIKRKLTEEEWSGSVTGLVAFLTQADNLSASNKVDILGKMKRSYWFTMRASLVNPPSERELRALAPQIALGTSTISAVQVYNLVPWTWLLDWFTTTGDLLAAYRGGLKWNWSGLNVMYKTDYNMTARFPSKRAGFTYSPSLPQCHGVVLRRIQPTLGTIPSWRIPYLTGRQWSILSSLAVLRL
jgi:hypothetical protein